MKINRSNGRNATGYFPLTASRQEPELQITLATQFPRFSHLLLSLLCPMLIFQLCNQVLWLMSPYSLLFFVHFAHYWPLSYVQLGMMLGARAMIIELSLCVSI